MKAQGEVLGLLLILAGSLSLAFDGFTYTKETHRADLGGIHLRLDEKEQLRIPAWLAAAGIVLGVALLLGRRKG